MAVACKRFDLQSSFESPLAGPCCIALRNIMRSVAACRYFEIGRGALATPVEGQQYGELLPNATGADRITTLNAMTTVDDRMSPQFRAQRAQCAQHKLLPPTFVLLPAGNYCQDIKLQKGAQYRLSYYYGRLMTFKKQWVFGPSESSSDPLLCKMQSRPGSAKRQTLYLAQHCSPVYAIGILPPRWPKNLCAAQPRA